jgi:hypothetical protein
MNRGRFALAINNLQSQKPNAEPKGEHCCTHPLSETVYTDETI